LFAAAGVSFPLASAKVRLISELTNFFPCFLQKGMKKSGFSVFRSLRLGGFSVIWLYGLRLRVYR